MQISDGLGSAWKRISIIDRAPGASRSFVTGVAMIGQVIVATLEWYDREFGGSRGVVFLDGGPSFQHAFFSEAKSRPFVIDD